MSLKKKITSSRPIENRSDALLAQLSRKFGIQPVYRNEAGQLRSVPVDSLKEILKLMGIPQSKLEQFRKEPAELFREKSAESWTEIAADTIVVPQAKLSAGWTLSLPIEYSAIHQLLVHWIIKPDKGTPLKGRFANSRLQVLGRRQINGAQFVQFRVPFPPKLTFGYYTFQIEARTLFQSWGKTSRLIVTPDSCYLPPAFKQGGRLWGLTVQLYGIRSSQNWGIGDFRDLQDIIVWAGRDFGAAFVGVNPLHALLPDQISPYSPSSRLFHNPLYLHIEDIPEFTESLAAQRFVAGSSFQQNLASLRRSPTVQYQNVKELKFTVFEDLYKTFVKKHLVAKTQRGKAFLQFIRRQGPHLERFACFQALSETLAPKHSADWQKWPKIYCSPSSPEVQQWGKQNLKRINFYRYLEWQCVKQLNRVQRTAKRIGMPMGLYQDLAVGIDPRGADAWIYQDQLITRASIGTPPELFSPRGQTWGLSPLNPLELKRHGFEVFIQTFRFLLRRAGLVRIDHAMGLFRMFWIPHHRIPAQGAYVYYPASALLGILALESHLAKTTLVGEDLGTITPLIRRRLKDSGLLSYRLLFFEKTKQRRFISPEKYPRQAMVSVTTHDLPTLAGSWVGRDIEWKKKLELFSDPSQAETERRNREEEKRALLGALMKEGLLPKKSDLNSVHIPKLTPDLARAVHTFLARTPSLLLAISLEDLLGLEETPNIPGAPQRDYPVWRIKTGSSEDSLPIWRRSKEVLALASALKQIRGFQKGENAN